MYASQPYAIRQLYADIEFAISLWWIMTVSITLFTAGLPSLFFHVFVESPWNVREPESANTKKMFQYLERK